MSENSTENAKKEVIMISTESIMPNRCQPRVQFENDSLQRLSESIRKFGIIQPLSVRKIPENSKFSIFQYELIAGERRLRAAKLAGIEKVPCIIIETDTKTSAELAIIENLHRDDLNIFEEASAIASLIELHNLTQEQIAKELSITQAAVANKLRLLKLTNPEKTVILANNLTERHARALLRIKNDTERIKVLSHIISMNLNVRQSEEYIENLISPKPRETNVEKTSIISNYRNLLATISKAVESTRIGGLNVKTAQTETDSDIIFTVSIAK